MIRNFIDRILHKPASESSDESSEEENSEESDSVSGEDDHKPGYEIEPVCLADNPEGYAEYVLRFRQNRERHAFPHNSVKPNHTASAADFEKFKPGKEVCYDLSRVRQRGSLNNAKGINNPHLVGIQRSRFHVSRTDVFNEQYQNFMTNTVDSKIMDELLSKID